MAHVGAPALALQAVGLAHKGGGCRGHNLRRSRRGHTLVCCADCVQLWGAQRGCLGQLLQVLQKDDVRIACPALHIAGLRVVDVDAGGAVPGNRGTLPTIPMEPKR